MTTTVQRHKWMPWTILFWNGPKDVRVGEWASCIAPASHSGENWYSLGRRQPCELQLPYQNYAAMLKPGWVHHLKIADNITKPCGCGQCRKYHWILTANLREVIYSHWKNPIWLVRGQPRLETGPLYHFMFVEKGVWHPGSRPAIIYGLTTSRRTPL